MHEQVKTADSDSNVFKSLLNSLIVAISLLLIPFIAMQFTNEVEWSFSDFVMGGALIFATGMAYQFVRSKSEKLLYRIAFGITIFTSLLIVWSNLAVGIIGSEENPANLLYFIVVGLVGSGSFIAKFKAEKMYFVMLAVALTQLILTAIILFAFSNINALEVIIINMFFVGSWITSAMLFKSFSNKESLQIN